MQLLKIPNQNVLWDEATLMFGISDMRGIRNRIEIYINDKPIKMNPGAGQETLLTQAYHATSTYLTKVL